MKINLNEEKHMIKKRNIVTNDIFAELGQKYPIRNEKSGICYTQKMEYITIETDTFNSPLFKKFIKENPYGLIVYSYIRIKMCTTGWHLLWDEMTQDDTYDMLTLWGVAKECTIRVIEQLLQYGMLIKLSKDNVDYLTDIQQIYNWEMLQAKRQRDRTSKRTKTSPAYSAIEEIVPVAPLPVANAEEFVQQQSFVPQPPYTPQCPYSSQPPVPPNISEDYDPFEL